MTKTLLTMGDIARHYGLDTWQVRRLFERKMLPPALRCGLYRVVPVTELPNVEAALRGAGYLHEETANG